ncbi:MAG: Asp-tRNA(Asn)/Glu-tRNA(Gln) amidotransferase subunit GatC [Oceanicoccus sp.]|uniref:Asp-tRNA(Asn)/Glu-tRNA(Gln) amidotransferase subunit GatC n=1 Tax=Oceanicoccus sp. TaxID=2691044 RepID=UPI0026032B9F|nr:Asp-tRNA(Asn)/Glu-tRNA(Gln) amidotransferase subunit GatC [Oceanicoccus sp.]MCP3907967.1 Asp-tRNA(Asn)/Glu-tRNA(Gln) amidotransferase subunit GatC [Oceanicoccus sp.]MDG1773859.1 Asp-tRNA(Asn)/Glu-tRNA(Gln) amidotransferase subunit GatC [Oceanicoccus sp.]
MSVEQSDIEKIAILSRIRVAENDIPEVADRINDILAMVDNMQAVDTADVEPMANPLDAVQRLRDDMVTETNQRDSFQAIAPDADEGLYLVPKVIE